MNRFKHFWRRKRLETDASRMNSASGGQWHFYGRRGRQFYRKNSPLTHVTGQMQFAAVFAHDAEDNGKTKAGADTRRLGREKRVENARLNCSRNSRAIIADLEKHAFFGDAPGLHANRATFAVFLDGLPRVADKVHEHLLELPGVALHEWEHRV
jgi:hypothetical protein